MNKHVVTMLVYELSKALERLQRREIGFIDISYAGGIDYKIDDTVYEISVKVKKERSKKKC